MIVEKYKIPTLFQKMNRFKQPKQLVQDSFTEMTMPSLDVIMQMPRNQVQKKFLISLENQPRQPA